MREGFCLCGGVRVKLPDQVRDVGACHCAMCRRWTSGPWMALRAPGDINLEGDTITIYASSSFAERGFCRACGTVLFHRPKGGPEIAISAGLFEPNDMRLTREIFYDAKPGFYAFANATLKRSTLAMALAWGPRLLWRALLQRLEKTHA